MIDVAGQLAGIPLFSGLSKEQVAALARIGVRRACKKGEQLFAEGDEGSGFYVVLTGRVKISKVSPEGKEQILHMVGPGEPFGEVPVFAGQGFPADAAAAAQSTVLFFPRVAFVGLIKRDPTLALNMLAQLSRRLRQFAGLVEDLSLKEVPGRLAKYLLYLVDRDGQGAVELDISKGQIASLLGTIPETLSRILARFDREGLIRSKGKQIRIVDREGLERIAQEGR